MSNQEILIYLNTLSNKIVTMYSISKSSSDNLVDRSPMRKLLQEDAEYVVHMPMQSWAKLIYESFYIV